MVGVHLGDDEGHVLIHAEVLRVAQHEATGAREGRLDLTSDARIECGEHDGCTDLGWIAGQHRHVTHRLGNSASADPARRLDVLLAGGPLRCSELRDVEPRMVGEQPDERLTDGTRRSEDGDGDAGLRREGSHEARRVRTIRSYESTDCRSSFTSMNSSLVWATWIEPGPKSNGFPQRLSKGMSEV